MDMDRSYEANDQGSRRVHQFDFLKLVLPFEIIFLLCLKLVRFLLCKQHKVSTLVLEYPLW